MKNTDNNSQKIVNEDLKVLDSSTNLADLEKLKFTDSEEKEVSNTKSETSKCPSKSGYQAAPKNDVVIK